MFGSFCTVGIAIPNPPSSLKRPRSPGRLVRGTELQTAKSKETKGAAEAAPLSMRRKQARSDRRSKPPAAQAKQELRP